MLRLLRNDDGFAMAAVMGVVALVTVVAVGGYWVASQTLHESQRIEDESKAFQVAQSGLDRELASFNPSVLMGGTYTNEGSTPDGSYSISASQTSTFEYRMTSLGTAEGRQESVTQRFYFFNLWDMNIGAGQSTPFGSGSGFNGQATVDGPLYVKGDLDWDNGGATYEGGPLMVSGGDILCGANSTIGYARPVDIFCDGSNAGKKPGAVYFTSWSTSVPDIELPWLEEADMDEFMQEAIDQSVDNKVGQFDIVNQETTGTGNPPSAYDDGSIIPGRVKAAGASDYYKYIGPGTGHRPMGSGTTDLTIGNATFGAWEGGGYPPASGVHDDFAFYTDGLGNGILYVEGTVFIDGDLLITDAVTEYRGNGSLVVNGDVTLDSVWLEPKGGSMTKENVLGIIAAGDVTITGTGSNINFEGAVFCNGDFALADTHIRFEGSALCNAINGGSPNIHLQTNPILPSILPEAMPAINGQLYKGTWTRN